MSRSSCRVAIITGAARGLGYAIARALSPSVHCILVDVMPEVAQTATQVMSPLGAAQGIVADVGAEDAVAGAIGRVTAEHGRLDILVNNAGIHPRTPDNRPIPVCDVELEQWNRVLRVNLTGAFLCSKHSLPIMRAQKWGRVINMSSRTARLYTGTASAPYATSKAGLIALTRLIAGEEGKHGITANCIAAGTIRSPMTTVDGDAGLARRAALSPAGRVGEPEEIGAAVSYLVSDEAGFVNGAILDINGGSFMPA